MRRAGILAGLALILLLPACPRKGSPVGPTGSGLPTFTRTLSVEPCPCSATPTQTATPRLSPSFTNTLTVTKTMSNTLTTSSTLTATKTATPTFTISNTLTTSPTITVRATRTSTVSKTLSTTLTATPTYTFTPTATPTNTPTPCLPFTPATLGAAFGARDGQASVVFNSKIWVLGGYDGSGYKGDVWNSPDGLAWTQTASNAFPHRAFASATVFNSKLWIIGGLDLGSTKRNDVWSSPDGVTWTREIQNAGFSCRYGHSAVVFGGQLWVIGGRDDNADRNDIWSSPDGVNWTLANANPPFAGRHSHSAEVYDAGAGLRIWVMAGWSVSTPMNDVWSSPDGVSWAQATGSAAFSKRFAQTTAVFDDGGGLRLWILGGWDAAYRSDIWSSADGVGWTFESGCPNFGPRDSHSSVVFDAGSGSKIWVIGGADGSEKGDVWHSP